MYYNSLNNYLREIYKTKVYKISLSSGATCPNRDGTLSKEGCIFCDGAGAFAAAGDIDLQIQEAKKKVAKKLSDNPKYIAYFQSFTNTYGDEKHLEKLYKRAIEDEDIIILSIATRPDCLSENILKILADINKIKPVWIELGLQTIHESSANFINRRYELEVYDSAVLKLKAIGVKIIVHQIIGLPYETKDMMVETARYIGNSGADGIKLHLLHIIKGTSLADMWQDGRIKVLELDEYIDILIACIRTLPENIVIHRMTGDGDKRTLLAPLWSADKKRVLNTINKAFLEAELCQGSECRKI